MRFFEGSHRLTGSTRVLDRLMDHTPTAFLRQADRIWRVLNIVPLAGCWGQRCPNVQGTKPCRQDSFARRAKRKKRGQGHEFQGLEARW